MGQAASACLSASLGVTVPVDHRLSPTHRALLPTPTGIESEASISTVVWRDWSSLVARRPTSLGARSGSTPWLAVATPPSAIRVRAHSWEVRYSMTALTASERVKATR